MSVWQTTSTFGFSILKTLSTGSDRFNVFKVNSYLIAACNAFLLSLTSYPPHVTREDKSDKKGKDAQEKHNFVAGLLPMLPKISRLHEIPSRGKVCAHIPSLDSLFCQILLSLLLYKGFFPK